MDLHLDSTQSVGGCILATTSVRLVFCPSEREKQMCPCVRYWGQRVRMVSTCILCQLEPEYDSLLETSGKDCASGRGGGEQ